MIADKLQARKSMPVLRSTIALIVTVLLCLIIDYPQPWLVINLIGLVSFGAGYGVEALVNRYRSTAAKENASADCIWGGARQQQV